MLEVWINWAPEPGPDRTESPPKAKLKLKDVVSKSSNTQVQELTPKIHNGKSLKLRSLCLETINSYKFIWISLTTLTDAADQMRQRDMWRRRSLAALSAGAIAWHGETLMTCWWPTFLNKQNHQISLDNPKRLYKWLMMECILNDVWWNIMRCNMCVYVPTLWPWHALTSLHCTIILTETL